MRKIIQKLKRNKNPVLIFALLFLFCFFIQYTSIMKPLQETSSNSTSNPFHASVTYDSGTVILENNITTDNILIMTTANVTLNNYTVQGSIYVFNYGILHMLQNSNVTENVVISDASRFFMDNSTVGGTIECRDNSILELSDSQTLITTVWKFDAANLTISNTSIGQLWEFGVDGQIQILDSQITLVTLNGILTSRTYINNSNILSLNDVSLPMNIITGPISFDPFSLNFTAYSTSEREINLTWIGWDSPVIDGYMNITFQILVDGQLYTEINGSGFYNQYSGSLLVNITTTGSHNISVVSIDGSGNNFTSTIDVEIIEYPSFPWVYFWIVVAIILGIIAAAALFLRHKQNQGYHSSLSTIFKKELTDSKIKILIFVALAALPGILLYFIFGLIAQQEGTLTIDSIRSLVSMIFTMFLYYFSLAFSIVFAAGSVVNAKKDGSLSWFLSKPVRRWEFLWGKIFAYLTVIVLVMISTSVAFVLGSISFINPLYIPDLFSMGGYVFLIGIATLITLTSVVILCSSVFKKPGFTIFIPIILLMMIPPLVSFLPILTGNEWPLLLSFSYYTEQLGGAWVSMGGGLFGSIGSSYGSMFGITITPLDLTTYHIILILSGITIVCLVLATLAIQKKDIP